MDPNLASRAFIDRRHDGLAGIARELIAERAKVLGRTEENFACARMPC